MKYVITLIATLTITLSVSAFNKGQQDHRHLEERAQSRVEYLSIVLDLNGEQKKEMEGIQSVHMENVKQIRDQYSDVLDEMKDELKTIRQGSEGKFEESKEKAKVVRDKYDSQLAPMKEALDAEKASLDEVLSKVFSTDQYDKYLTLKTFKEGMRSKKGPHHKCH